MQCLPGENSPSHGSRFGKARTLQAGAVEEGQSATGATDAAICGTIADFIAFLE